ncbi:elongation factor G [Candidatus Acetothermia bacterium]|nr:elongation factor G [Candidatus Acetothermia bacterium]MCI2427613.1 elongation factor G [Candidatus Acetothermia bacterium]MCI2428225.1 elongation factor G [Candidatus Acetothermia bacterium]
MRIDKIRNIGIIAHIDAGKTTLTERILFTTGQIYKVGEVHEGNTEMDWMAQERARGITITSAVTSCPWNGYQINIIDTPGHVDFTAEVVRSLRILDGGVVLFSGVEMVEAQTETVWRQADHYKVPRIAFINKLDRVESNFIKTVEMIEDRLSGRPVPLQFPYRDPDRRFLGMIDILTMNLIIRQDTPHGTESKLIPIKKEESLSLSRRFIDRLERYREIAVERVAEIDDRVMERYLNEGDIDLDLFYRTLRQGCLEFGYVPVLGGSAFTHQGIQPLLDAITNYLPSPLDIPSVSAIDDPSIIRRADEQEPLAALAYKVMTDRYAGRLVFLRIYSGTLDVGQTVFNSSRKEKLRIMKLYRMHANDRTPLNEAKAGDIIAVVGSKNIATGDTICDVQSPILLEEIRFPEPVISVAIEPLGDSESARLSKALQELEAEDPTFKVSIAEETNQIIISGMGELHLEVLLQRLQDELGVNVNAGLPQVSYRETLSVPTVVEEKFVKQTGGHGQYGHVILELSPLERGRGFEFKSAIKGGEIPREYISSVETGLIAALDNGPLAGYPIVDLRAVLVGGSFHPVDSSDLAFRSAATRALRKVCKTNFTLLEPIMEGEIVTPVEYLGDVMEDIARRRGIIKKILARDAVQVITVAVPLAEMFGYATQVRSLTQGRATHSLWPAYYTQVPAGIKEKIIKSRGA